MLDIPKQVDRRVAAVLRSLAIPVKIIKKRDHYFAKIGQSRPVCIGNNSAGKDTQWRVNKTIHNINRVAREENTNGRT